MNVNFLKLWYCVPVCALFLLPCSKCDDLIFSHLLWRHGDRTPIHVIPSDTKNNESSWRQGLGELTKIGILGEFRLGQLIKTRYVDHLNFLDLCNASREIYVRSTDFNRTLMSAFSLLSGLLNSSCYHSVLNEKLFPKNWYPFPVHTMLDKDDVVLGELSCPKADWIFKETVEKTPRFQNFSKSHRDFYDKLSNFTGTTVNYTNVGSIFDTLFVTKCHTDEHEMPTWATDNVYEMASKLSDISDSFQVENDDYNKLRRGLLLKEIVDRFNAKIQLIDSHNASMNSWLNDLRFYAYSAHDTTLMSFLATLGVYKFVEFFVPHYSSCILVELWKTMEGSYVVKILYRKGIDEEFKPLQVYGCPDLPEPCLFSTFVQRSRHFFPTDWKSECSLYPNFVSHLQVLAFVLWAFLMVIFLAVLFLCYSMGKYGFKQRRKYDGYHRVQLDSMSDKLINGSLLADIDGWDDASDFSDNDNICDDQL